MLLLNIVASHFCTVSSLFNMVQSSLQTKAGLINSYIIARGDRI